MVLTADLTFIVWI